MQKTILGYGHPSPEDEGWGYLENKVYEPWLYSVLQHLWSGIKFFSALSGTGVKSLDSYWSEWCLLGLQGSQRLIVIQEMCLHLFLTPFEQVTQRILQISFPLIGGLKKWK